MIRKWFQKCRLFCAFLLCPQTLFEQKQINREHIDREDIRQQSFCDCRCLQVFPDLNAINIPPSCTLISTQMMGMLISLSYFSQIDLFFVKVSWKMKEIYIAKVNFGPLLTRGGTA